MSAMERWPNETITEFWVRQIMAEARAPLEAEIAALRAALDGLVKAAERVLAYGRVRPFADAARDQLRAALAAAKETQG